MDGLNLPGAQASHPAWEFTATPVENVPTGHPAHALMPSSENVPAEQFEQEVALGRDVVPAGQRVHDVWPTSSEKDPLRQSRQAVPSVPVEYFPAPQSAHPPCPSPKVPGPHPMQMEAPSCENLPSWHGEQEAAWGKE